MNQSHGPKQACNGPAFKDKIAAQIIAHQLMQHLHDVDLRHAEFAHHMMDRGFSILMETIEETESYDIYLSLICFLQELEVNGFGIFYSNNDSVPTFTMRHEFIPIASAACVRALRQRNVQTHEGDIKAVMMGQTVSLRCDPTHPKAIAKAAMAAMMLPPGA